MSKLIDADKLITDMNTRAEEEYLEFRDIRNMVEYAPTIHAIPVDKVKTAREEIKGKAFTLDDVLAILDKLITESEETDTQKCHDCADYNQEKHYCPKYCDLIRNTMNDNINAVLEDVKDEVKNIVTFDNLDLLVEVAKIIDSHKRGQE